MEHDALAKPKYFWLDPTTTSPITYLPDSRLGKTIQKGVETLKDKKTVRDEAVRFCQNTSGHGLARLVDPEENCFCKLMWIWLIAGALASILYFWRESVKQVFDTGLTTELIQVDQDNMTLPSIHLCDYTALNATVLTELGFNQTLSWYLLATVSPLSLRWVSWNDTSKSDLNNNTHDLEQLDLELRSVLRQRDMSLDHVLELASLKCPAMILQCSMQSIFYSGDVCCQMFFVNKTWINLYGSCISSHGTENVQMIESRNDGLNVKMRINRQHAINMTGSSRVLNQMFAQNDGLFYAVSEKSEFILTSLVRKGVYAPLHSWTSNAIKRTVFDRSKLQKERALFPNRPNCVGFDDDKGVKHALEYTIHNGITCNTEDRVAKLQKQGNCTTTFLNKNTIQLSGFLDSTLPLCSPLQLLKALQPMSLPDFILTGQALGPACPKSCLVNNYEITTNSIPLREPQDQDMAVISFYFPKFSYYIYKTRPQTIIGLLGQVGGYMGLLMGVSCLTIVEFFVFLFRSLRASILCRYAHKS